MPTTRGQSVRLPLHRCPKCDYDVTALPRAHRCPECGFEYDERTVLLPAFDRGSWLSRGAELVMGVLAGLLVFGSMVLLLERGNPLPLLCLAGLFAVPLVLSHRTRKRLREGKGTLHLLLSGAGAAVRHGGRLGRLCPWSALDVRRLTPVEPGVWRVQLRPAWWRLSLSRVLDMHVLADEDEAAMLRALLAGYG